MAQTQAAITEQERRVLDAIAHNYFLDGDEPLGKAVWSNCINDSDKPSGVEGKALSGIVSSLVQKKLVGSDRECVWIKQAGLDALACVCA